MWLATIRNSFTSVRSASPRFTSLRSITMSSQSEIKWVGARPDDLHHHLRDGDAALSRTVSHVTSQFARCIVMPNLVPPVTTTEQALAYRERIMTHVPEEKRDPNSPSGFEPLMTLYMTDSTAADEIRRAAETKKIFAVKLYPAGATTNSDSGVTKIDNIYPALEAMADVGMPLLVHGEVTDPSVDLFDREATFVEQVIKPLVAKFPQLKVVMEHITTKEAAEFITNAPANVAATITPQHLLFNRNAIFQGGLRPHKYCLPVLKRETHRQALLQAIASGSKKFFLGTDSAPHVSSKKESGCGCAGIYSAHAALELYAEAFESIGKLDLFRAFACENGADFYGIKRNTVGDTVLKKESWTVPDSYPFDNGVVVPLRAGETIAWKLQ
ncbi:Amidohydrolase family [Phytophthora infestans]|uniref:Dihydroorotase, mitochondrial n=1 Tax=Phytophthora infestans TaxID=4787 RepID=A0A833SZJ6_PHYIN|nr:Amidohydrolase family [Phytophthora infestans]KAF4131788.1 Amidohydrolase family [Phytophthora infestans]